MKGVVLLILVLVLCTGISAQVRTCRDIQTTTEVSGNSPYMDQTVQVRGIVTAIKRGSSFFIGDALSAGDDGRWSGLSVSDATLSNTVQLGDMYNITGTVKEVGGVTKLMLLTGNQLESPGNPVPVSTVTTAILPFGNASSEAWEGVMVRFNNVKITTSVNIFGQFQFADADVAGVAEAKVDDYLYAYPSSSIVVGDTWYKIQGVVDYSTSDGYRVLPRSLSDYTKEDNIQATKISIKSASGSLDTEARVEVKTTKLKTEWNVTKYSMILNIDASLVRFNGVDINGTITPTIPTYTVVGNVITITYDGAKLIAPEGESTLIKLLLEPQTYGVVPLVITSFSYNDIPMTALENGNLSVVLADFVAYMNIGTATSDKNIFDPMVGKIKIEYGTKGGFLARAIIRIYDAQGRVVATPLNKNFTGATTVQQIDSFEWNGRDGSMNLLPPGLYYCNMEVANRQNGAIARSVQPIVIKSRLK